MQITEKDGEQIVQELSPDQKLMQQAFALKEEGNYLFKTKDFKKAIGKYVRINLFLKNILSSSGEGGQGEGDPAMAMLQGRMKTTLTQEEIQACKELQATAYLNMAICHHLTKNFQKAAENAQKSSGLNPSIKAFYREGQAWKAMANYEQAI